MNDRLSMAHGVELRQPFLDYRLVEFAARLPADFKLQDGWGKHVLRRAMERRLPEEIVWTSKRPVVTPQREWMTGPLREWVGDIVSQPDFSAMGMFDVRAVRATFDNYLGGRLNNAFPVWQWINSYLWYSTFSGLATQSVKTL
jgi:asparagine synthase (glutamine-hydrolysing)